MLRQLALASVTVLTPALASAEATKFRIEEATIEDIQAAIRRGQLTSTRVVQLYLSRINADKDTCVMSISPMEYSRWDRIHPSRMRINSMP